MNRLNRPIKRQASIDWVEKTRCNFMSSTGDTVDIQRYRLTVEVGEEMHHKTNKHKKLEWVSNIRHLL